MHLFHTTFSSILSSGHPYLNPGTGGLIIQLVLGAVFAIGLTTRVFWSKIKQILKPGHSNQTESTSEVKDDTH